MKRKDVFLRGITLWGIWISRNDVVFKHEVWNEPRIQQYIWDSLLDYGRLDWSKTKARLNSAPPEQKQNILSGFDSRWTRRKIIASRLDLTVKWNLVPPSCLSISW
jgi:hypothetical protein